MEIAQSLFYCPIGDNKGKMAIFDSPPSEDKSEFLGARLVNHWNTCYLISALQCLFHTVPLVLKFEDASCHKHTSGDKSEFCPLNALKELFFLSMESESPVRPSDFINNLNKISSSFRLGNHEDSHEFLLGLLEKLDECSSDQTSTDKKSLVNQVFGGQSTSLMLCSNCGHSSVRSDLMLILTLGVSGVNSLTDALESYIKAEELEGVKCDRCESEVLMVTQTKIEQAPEVMSFQLSRYNSYGQKIDNYVEYPLELDLRPFIKSPKDEEQTIYELYAVLVHSGTALYGHYYSYVRSSSTTWHKKDDDICNIVTEAEVLCQCQKAYILFYAKKGSPYFSSLVSQFVPSPKSVLYPNGNTLSPNFAEESISSSSRESPEKYDFEMAAEKQENDDSHDNFPSTSHKCDDISNRQKISTLMSPIRTQATKRPNNDHHAIDLQSTKRLNSDYHESDTQATKKLNSDYQKAIHIDDSYFNDEKSEEDEREESLIPHFNDGPWSGNKKASPTVLESTNCASHLNSSTRNIMRGMPKGRKEQFLACMTHKKNHSSKMSPTSKIALPIKSRLESFVKSSPLTRKPTPLDKNRRALHAAPNPSKDASLSSLSTAPLDKMGHASSTGSNPYKRAFASRDLSSDSTEQKI